MKNWSYNNFKETFIGVFLSQRDSLILVALNPVLVLRKRENREIVASIPRVLIANGPLVFLTIKCSLSISFLVIFVMVFVGLKMVLEK